MKRARTTVSIEDVIEMSGVETLHPGGLDLTRRIGEVLRIDPSHRVLDVSSGKGLFACTYAAELGCRVTGIDINERFVSLARTRAARQGLGDQVEFRVGDARALPFGAGEFDVVVNECAVGLTAIGDPAGVLLEMARVAKPGGWVVIHESTWRKELPVEERQEAARRFGTMPCSVDEWQRMLLVAGCRPVVVEDWSGPDNLRKVRPDHRWSPDDPAGFLTTREKLTLLPRIAIRHGIGALLDLQRTRRLAAEYLRRGLVGYVLIAARKEDTATAENVGPKRG
ncbi:MAG TPA: hypothetical protein DCQ64_02105 [Candidatus Rokubacteria bacterium]|nr:MAG: hypothetical protein A2X53_19555 [Candidatus Rokubacteria bacterium GWA2_70_23]OGK90061.1 MAG: hypothetical protein A2X50_08110 [Candidatus Rokubacteria bacterium GWF2_70_14]HAM54252.1 hypothetical protein [Candidatus Rokubacteria bacterium]